MRPDRHQGRRSAEGRRQVSIDTEAATTFGRVPPQDRGTERSLLGEMMLSKDAIDDVAGTLKGHDFYYPAHETIYAVIVDLYGRGEPADPLTVGAELTKRGELDRVGGAPYLFALTQAAMSAANAEYHAEIVREKAVLRRLAEAGETIAAMGYGGEGGAAEIVDRAQAAILGLTAQQADDTLGLVGDLSEEWLDELEQIGQRKGEITGVPTGFIDLDSLTNGLQPGQLIVIAGRPAMGKSTLALDVARHAAIRYHMPTAFFSLEMSRKELMSRMHSAEARVGLHHMRSGTMTDEDWTRLARRMPDVSAAPLYIDDGGELTLMNVCIKARRLKQRNGLRLIVVDYLQLMQSGSGRRGENRQQEVADMSRRLKLLAKELDVPVIALSQLNRGSEQRSDKKPVLSDLRESGAIEQDADMVILVHREDAYEKESPRSGEADLIVAKHRNGPTATVTVAFQGHYSRFVDMAQT
ncbi:replicative DNA helicase [Streptomyces mirabilis]|uniref:replicative DNA helicase n=1 Tax=Streptomyces mirabilis TaxID=68239 RepID=UPI0036411893